MANAILNFHFDYWHTSLMSILCQNAFTKYVFFKHGFDPPPLLNNVKKLQDWYRAASLKQILARSTLIKSTKQRLISEWTRPVKAMIGLRSHNITFSQILTLTTSYHISPCLPNSISIICCRKAIFVILSERPILLSPTPP